MSTTTDVVRHVPSPTPSPQELETMERVASQLAASGMFKDVRQAAQAFAKIALGRGLGLDPASSMTAIHIVEGKPELSANLQAAMLRQFRGPDGERYDYRVVAIGPDGCSLVFTRRWPDGTVEEIGASSFTREDAQRAGLANRGPWKTYPANMMFARAISNGVAWYAPEVTYGMRVYSDGEIDPGREFSPPDVSSETVPDAPRVERATRDEYKYISDARKALGFEDDRLYGSLLDKADLPEGDTIRERLRHATREQVAEVRRLLDEVAARDAAADAPPADVDSTAVEEPPAAGPAPDGEQQAMDVPPVAAANVGAGEPSR
ncbi:MAG: hypothetical protein M0P31_13855 [Solirubrobacteraceae bacterium]|nr:hypothetical protein [Solirubrobacteraceae bacterium]